MRVSNISFMILNRYFLKSIFSYTLTISLIFILIIVSSRSIQYLEQAARGEINPEIVFSIILFRLPEFLELILPLGFFLSIILTIGKFRAESEFVIMEQSGFNITKVYSLLCIPLSLIIILLFYFSSTLNPDLNVKVKNLLSTKSLEDTYKSLTPGKFRKLSEETLLFAKSKDEKGLTQIFFRIKDDENSEQVLVANRFQPNELLQESLLFEDGSVYFKNENKNLSSIEFERFKLNNVLLIDKPLVSEDPPSKKDSIILWTLSLCVMTALSIFIAVPISKTSPRKGRYVRVLPGLFIFSLYSGFLLSLKGSESDKIVSLVLIHMIFFVLSIFLNYINFVRTK